MLLGDLVLSIVGPASAILISFVVSHFEGKIITDQCDRIAHLKSLSREARNVMAKTAEAAVVVMSFFPTFISFVISFFALALAAPSANALSYVLAAILIAALVLITRPVYMVWSQNLYDLHNRAPRLLGGARRRPGRWSYLEVIQHNLLFFNIILIIVPLTLYFLP